MIRHSFPLLLLFVTANCTCISRVRFDIREGAAQTPRAHTVGDLSHIDAPPIRNVRVSIWAPRHGSDGQQEAVHTGADGSVRMQLLYGYPYRFRCEKAGYRTVEAELPWDNLALSARRTLLIFMERSTAGPGEP